MVLFQRQCHMPTRSDDAFRAQSEFKFINYPVRNPIRHPRAYHLRGMPPPTTPPNPTHTPPLACRPAADEMDSVNVEKQSLSTSWLDPSVPSRRPKSCPTTGDGFQICMANFKNSSPNSGRVSSTDRGRTPYNFRGQNPPHIMKTIYRTGSVLRTCTDSVRNMWTTPDLNLRRILICFQ